MLTKPLRDKTGREILPGDVLRVFHFTGARRKRHYMYKFVKDEIVQGYGGVESGKSFADRPRDMEPMEQES